MRFLPTLLLPFPRQDHKPSSLLSRGICICKISRSRTTYCTCKTKYGDAWIQTHTPAVGKRKRVIISPFEQRHRPIWCHDHPLNEDNTFDCLRAPIWIPFEMDGQATDGRMSESRTAGVIVGQIQQTQGIFLSSRGTADGYESELQLALATGTGCVAAGKSPQHARTRRTEHHAQKSCPSISTLHILSKSWQAVRRIQLCK